MNNCFRLLRIKVRPGLLLLGMALFISAQVLAAGTGTIRGRVTDKDTKDALPGANVVIKTTSLGAAASLDGSYVIYNVPVGQKNLQVTFVGYTPITISVNVEENKTVYADVAMSVQAIEGQTVVVAGQAKGQMQAINQQLSSNTITNIVSSEKIHELPDENAATALSRLPGLSLMNGDQVVIRGIQAQENIILLNGVQLPSTDMNNRSTNLGFISSNMLSGIEVTKVVTADMDANAIGGVVNLRLREAPQGLHYDLLTQGMYNGQDRTLPVRSNYQVWGSVSDRFFDNTFGVFVQGNARRLDGGNEYANATYQAMGAGRDAPYGQETFGMQQFSFNDNVNVVNDGGGSIILDYLYPNGKLLFQNSVALTKNNLANLRDVSDIPTARRLYTMSRDINQKVLFISGLQGENTFHDMKLDYSIAHSISTKRTDLRYGDPTDIPGFDFTSAQPAFPSYTTDDQLGFTLPQVYTWPFYTDDWSRATVEQFAATRFESYNERLTTGQANFTVPMTVGDLFSAEFKVGGKYKYSSRDNDVERYNQRIVQPGSNNGALPFLQSIDPAYYTSPDQPLQFSLFKNYDFKRGNYFLGGAHVMDNVLYTKWMDEYFREAYPLWKHHTADSKRNDFNGTEAIGAGYAMGTFNIGPRLSVIAGARFEHFNMDYKANFVYITHSVDGDAAIPDTLNTAKRTRDDWFPNFHIRYKLTDWMDVRVAYSKTLTRPDYTAMLPVTVIDPGSNTAQVGNPNLKPAVAKNVDAYLSFYNNDIGLLTVGGFYKRIDDFFYFAPRVLAALKVSGIPFPDSAAFANLHLPQLTQLAVVNAYMNNPSPAFLRGVELEWQTHFWYLPNPLNFVVLNVNYARIFSKMDYQQINFQRVTVFTPRPEIRLLEVDTIYTTRLLNQGNDVVNVSLGFDYKGLSARISYRLQGNVISTVGSRPENDIYTGDVSNWDFAIRQNLPVEGLSVYLNGLNITHAPVDTYQDFRRVVGGPILSNQQQRLYSPSLYELGIRYSY